MAVPMPPMPPVTYAMRVGCDPMAAPRSLQINALIFSRVPKTTQVRENTPSRCASWKDLRADRPTRAGSSLRPCNLPAGSAGCGPRARPGLSRDRLTRQRPGLPLGLDHNAPLRKLLMRAQMEMAAEQCDVAVIGGGPAGSTAAALLARRGYHVVALEKAHHPRFHIGESLLPMNLPIFERLGVLDQGSAPGVFKRGADFEADNESGYNTFAFDRAIGSSPPHAYQVWRQDFDKMLYEHARECGANAREGHEAGNIEPHGPRETRLDVRTDDGRSYPVSARYLVDASG